MSDQSLAGKTAIVTGGSGGLGAAIVRQFEAAGAIPHVLDRHPAAEIPEDRFHAVDVQDATAVTSAIQQVVDTTGRLDALVVAAGITRDRVLWKLTDAEWHEVVGVNLDAAFYALRAAIPTFRSQGSGSVVFIASINGERGKFGQGNYAASKSGLLGLARTAARELGSFGVRVNVVSPGFIDTPMTRDAPDEARERALMESLLGRIGRPDDVAGPVLFLCSEQARHITGQVLRVDGGQYL